MKWPYHVSLYKKDTEELKLDLYLVMVDMMSLGVILGDKKVRLVELVDSSFFFVCLKMYWWTEFQESQTEYDSTVYLMFVLA